jgi:hypothetical protein
MNRERLDLVRMTRLDLAQWITSGIGKCRNRETSLCLARYAAAQLEGAALIPPARSKTQKPGFNSLLRAELSRSGSNTADCLMILARVSRSMLRTLAGESERERRTAMRDLTVARVVQLEVAALRALLNSGSNKAAA